MTCVRTHQLLFLVSCGSGFWGCGSSVTRPERIALAQGCYQLSLDPPLSEPFRGFVPAIARLDTVPRWRRDTVNRPRQLDGLAIEPRNPRLTYMVGPPHWELFDRNSIKVEWGSGLGGVTMKLRQHGTTLRGTAVAYTDVGGAPQPSFQVSAVRVQCPASPIQWVNAE